MFARLPARRSCSRVLPPPSQLSRGCWVGSQLFGRLPMPLGPRQARGPVASLPEGGSGGTPEGPGSREEGGDWCPLEWPVAPPYTIQDAQGGPLCGTPGASARARAPRPAQLSAAGLLPLPFASCGPSRSRPYKASQGPCLLPSLWGAPLVFRSALLAPHCSTTPAILCRFLLSLESKCKDGRHIHGPHRCTHGGLHVLSA